MLCFKVTDQAHQQSKLTFNQTNSTFLLNQQPLQVQLPLYLQKFPNYFYSYMNQNITIAIHEKNYSKFIQLLQNNRISYVKVPDKTTQILSSQYYIQSEQQIVLVHCGSYNYQQDCFIVMKGNYLQIRNKNNFILYQGQTRQVQYDDLLKRIKLRDGNCFYFWKCLEYLAAKSLIGANTLIIQQQVNNRIQQQQIMQQQRNQQFVIRKQMVEEQKIQQQKNQNQQIQKILQVQQIQLVQQFQHNQQVQYVQYVQQAQQYKILEQKAKQRDILIEQQFLIQSQVEKQLAIQKIQRLIESQKLEEQYQQPFIQKQVQKQQQKLQQPNPVQIQKPEQQGQKQKQQQHQQQIPQSQQQVSQVQQQLLRQVPQQRLLQQQSPIQQQQHEQQILTLIQNKQENNIEQKIIAEQSVKQQKSQIIQYQSQNQDQQKSSALPGRKFIKKQQRNFKKNKQIRRQKLPSPSQQIIKIPKQQTNTIPTIQNIFSFLTPKKIINTYNQNSANDGSNSQASQSNIIKPLLQLLIRNTLQSYLSSQYKIELCCLNGSDVLDIRSKEGKQYLYYHQFGKVRQGQGLEQEQNVNQEDDGGQAQSRQLCQLKFIDEDGIAQLIKPSKLVFDSQTNSTYFNDTQRQYLHCYNLSTSQLSSHYLKNLVLDIVIHLNGSILAIHQNQIFQFNTLHQKKISLAKYKTVHNLSKISSVFGQFYYVTASDDGGVRTYDMRTYQKAINKFKLPVGITSLQVSNGGDYILCRYGHKAQILSCLGKDNNSAFDNRLLKSQRKKAKKLLKGYQHLSHIQFKLGNKHQGDIIALDQQNHSQLYIKNIQLSSSQKIYKLKYNEDRKQIQFLTQANKWIIYGISGKYYRENLFKQQ